jgi:alkylated DNA repair dioxygenase AlkB
MKKGEKDCILCPTGNIPDGFHLMDDAVSEACWERLRTWMELNEEIPWEVAVEGRRVAQFGVRYSYVDQKVDHTPVAPIPEFLREMFFPQLNVGDGQPAFAQCIINCYGARDAIPFHMDDRHFGDDILVFTFLEQRPLCMRRIDNNHSDKCKTHCHSEHKLDTFTALPGHRSCYKLSGEARWHWEHAVPEGRESRVSFTFRTVPERTTESIINC